MLIAVPNGKSSHSFAKCAKNGCLFFRNSCGFAFTIFSGQFTPILYQGTYFLIESVRNWPSAIAICGAADHP